MSKKLCVYTCITGDYDNLHEIETLEKDVDYFCFTNNKKLQSKTWKIIHIDNEGLDDHHLSRKIKMLGHPIIAKNYDTSVWMDASVIWQKKVTDFVKTYLKDNAFAAFKHHERTSVYEEAITCLRFHKDSKNNILRALNFLNSEYFPDNLGLFEMTVFVKKHNNPKVIEAMNLWFNINQKYSKRDQLSFMYAIWKTGLKVSSINLNVWNNPWFYTVTHTKNSSLKYCSVYYGDSSQIFSFNQFQTYKYRQNINQYSIECRIPNDTPNIEISPFNTINVAYRNITFKPTPTHISSPDVILYNNHSIPYSEHHTFRLTGNFRKNQTLSISFEAYILNPSELYQIVQQLEFQNFSAQKEFQRTNAELLSANRELKQTIDNLDSQLKAILNSKSWKAIRAIRKTIPISHKNTAGEQNV